MLDLHGRSPHQFVRRLWLMALEAHGPVSRACGRCILEPLTGPQRPATPRDQTLRPPLEAHRLAVVIGHDHPCRVNDCNDKGV